MSYNKKSVLEDNIKALETMFSLERRSKLNPKLVASDLELERLRKYKGFGGLKCILNLCDKPEDIQYWTKSEEDLFKPTMRLRQTIIRNSETINEAKKLLTSLENSVLTSFYTDEELCSQISASILGQLQVRGAQAVTVLDPAYGMGAFSLPYADKVNKVYGVEKDILAAKIAKWSSSGNSIVLNQSYENFDKDNTLKCDLVTTNIPFGDVRVFDESYHKTKKQDPIRYESTNAIHNYYFVKSLDKVKEGGVHSSIKCNA